MIFTIGFTKKSAEEFFGLLNENNIDVLIDVRLNNNSQLASFAKYPDIKFFLDKLLGIKYIHDVNLAPSDELLKNYRKKLILWDEYENVFKQIMRERDILKHIEHKYSQFKDKNICLLCSEPTAQYCHRRLVSAYFKKVFNVETTDL